MVLITISIILSHLMSCLHIPRSGCGYKLYVPEGTIIERGSDLVLYRLKRGRCNDPNGTKDGNVAIYHQYIVDISGVGPFGHDFYKQK